jgi:hypothetical protein
MAICGCGLPACCCQPAVAGGIIYADLRGEFSTHLALQAFFTQSSPVHEPLLQAFLFPSTLGEVTLHPLSQACVFVYSSHGKWVFPLSCGVFLPPPLLQAFPLVINGQCCCSCQPPCLFTAHVGSGSSLLSCGVFLPPLLSQAFLPLVAGHAPLLLLEPLWPAWLVYLQFREGFPSPNLQCSVHPTLFPVCLYCSYCLLLSFSFFPQVEVSLSRGLCCSGPGLSVGVPQYCGTSSQAIWAWATGGPGALLVSLFNVKWKCSVLAGGVEGSKFCLFSVVLPARWSPASLQDFTIGGTVSFSSL